MERVSLFSIATSAGGRLIVVGQILLDYTMLGIRRIRGNEVVPRQFWGRQILIFVNKFVASLFPSQFPSLQSRSHTDVVLCSWKNSVPV